MRDFRLCLCEGCSNLWRAAAQAQAKQQAGDLVVTVVVDTAAPEAALASLRAALGAGGALSQALGTAGIRVAPESLRVLPPTSDE
jgi:hypothetical protein